MTTPFAEGWAAGEIRYRHCLDCDARQLLDRPLCPRCGGDRLAWRAASGRGTVFAVTAVHRAPTPALRARVPYVVVLVDMAEGFRMMAHGEAGLRIGDAVCADFHDFDGRRLPIFRAAS